MKKQIGFVMEILVKFDESLWNPNFEEEQQVLKKWEKYMEITYRSWFETWGVSEEEFNELVKKERELTGEGLWSCKDRLRCAIENQTIKKMRERIEKLDKS